MRHITITHIAKCDIYLDNMWNFESIQRVQLTVPNGNVSGEYLDFGQI